MNKYKRIYVLMYKITKHLYPIKISYLTDSIAISDLFYLINNIVQALQKQLKVAVVLER